MNFLTPLYLALGLLALPIILLYMLRLRRREMLVSSTLLWEKLLRDREANAPWQRLRRNLLLLLQLLILAALVLALARPFFPVPSVVSGSVVVLLDGSASMLASDVEPTRFAAAVEVVAGWIDDLGGDDQMTLILVGATPTVLAAATNNRRELREALAGAVAGSAVADWSAALALASGAAQGFRDARIVLVSDGGLPDDLPPLPAETIYVPIGEEGENLALSALATRSTATGPQLFVSVTNYGRLEQESLVSIERNGVLFDSQRLTIPANQSRNLTWDLPEETATVTARLDQQSEDYLSLDDMAWAVHEGGQNNRLLLVTDGNLFLEQVFGVLPGVEAFKVPPDSALLGGAEEAPDDQLFDLYVLDGVAVPAGGVPGDLFVINPPLSAGEATSGDSLFTVTGIFSNTAVTRLSDSPLLQFVDWSGIDVRQAKTVSVPAAQTIVAAEGGPLLLIGEQGGKRMAILTFDLHDSDLPLQIEFPVLMANITSWLTPGRAFDTPTGIQPGDPVRITPGASSTAMLVEKPGGDLWTAPASEAAVIFAETEALGLYNVLSRDPNGDRPAGSFAVNLFAPQESAIRPVAAVRLGQTTVEAPQEGNVGQREIWPWLAGLAFLVLAVEWWVHFRGARFPRPHFRRQS